MTRSSGGNPGALGHGGNSIEPVGSDAEALREIALIAHGLREPLRSLTGFLELAAGQLDRRGDDEALALVARGLSTANRLRQRFDAYVAWARAAHEPLVMEPVELGRAVDQVVELLEATDPSARGRVRRGPLPTLRSDRTCIHRIFRELLANALQFGGDGTVCVEATSEAHRHRITIADSGPGFDSEHAESAFEPFTYLGDDRRGTGMGLAIARRTARHLGGDLWAASFRGRGTTLTLELPRAETDR